MKYRTTKGLTLIELFLALAVIAVIWVVATRYYQTVNLSSQVNDAISMVQAIRGASAQFAAGKANYSGLDMEALNRIGLLPRDFLTNGSNPGMGVNPWGGNLSVVPAGTNNGEIRVSLSNVPTQACENLVGKFKNQTQSGQVTCQDNTFTGTFA